MRRHGTVMIYTVLAIIPLGAILSLAVDFARVELAQSELYSATETAARYAVTGLVGGTAPTRGQTAATDNRVDGTVSGIAISGIETGTWNASTKVFTPTSADPNAVRVTAKRLKAAGTAIPLVFGAVIGRSTCDISATTVAYYNMNVMLVVGATPLSVTDQLAADHIAALGYHVVVIKDVDMTVANALAMRLVVISETITSGTLNTTLRNVAVPVICYEPFLVDDMSFTGSVQTVDFDLSDKASQLQIVTPSHPIAAGLSGTVTVSTVADGTRPKYLAWGKIASGGVSVACIPGDTTRSSVYAFDKGSLLKSGTAAPARRVGFFGSGPINNFNDGIPATTWTSNGWLLFENSVRWAIGNDPPIRTVQYAH